MAQQFLSQILRTENKVKSDPIPQCHICMQECGTICQETGNIECGIRLPCSHVFGSACITHWFHSHNTCPICRREFFPPHPSDEDEVVTDDEIDEEIYDEEEDDGDYDRVDQNLQYICEDLIRSLGFSRGVGRMATEMAVILWTADWYGGHLKRCTAAVAMFMMSHIMHEPRSLEEIADAAQVLWVPHINADHIRRVHRFVHPYREEIVPEDLPAEIAKDDIGGFAALLPAPSEGEFDAVEGSIHEHDGDVPPGMDWPELVDQSCARLGRRASSCVALISRLLTRNLAYALQTSPCSKRVTAVAIFMAFHLLGVPFDPTEDIADAVGVTEQSVRSLYSTIYPLRRGIVHHRLLREIGRTNLERALEAVPPLNWPRL